MFRKVTPFLLAIITLSACSSAPIAASELFLGNAVNEYNEVIEDTDVLAPTDHTLHAHAVMENVSEPTDVVGSWWFNEGMGENKIYESMISVTSDAPVAKFVLQNMNDWPAGNYRFAVSVAGEELSEVLFEVKVSE